MKMFILIRGGLKLRFHHLQLIVGLFNIPVWVSRLSVVLLKVTWHVDRSCDSLDRKSSRR